MPDFERVDDRCRIGPYVEKRHDEANYFRGRGRSHAFDKSRGG